MKRTITILIWLALIGLSNLIKAQSPELWGMTPNGGAQSGNIFKMIGDSNNFNNVYLFDSSAGLNPMGSLVVGSNGLLYGVTQNGGSMQKGAVFSYDPNTNTYRNLANFDGIHGEHPMNSLVLASNGLFYGKCQKAVVNYTEYNTGLIYSFDATTNTITYLKPFEGMNYLYPGGSLFQASDGKLYGMTVFRGTYDKGTLFRYDIAQDSLTVLKNFDSATIGSNPWGTLMQASNGKLYGMCKNGGAPNWGNIFTFDITNDSLQVVYNFTGLHGLSPCGTLVQTSNGYLYGMLQGSFNIDTSGNIFSFDPVTNGYQQHYAFHHSQCGHPQGNLIQAPNGWLYGMTYYGGADTSGVIFKYNPIDTTYQNVYAFDTIHGQHPRGDLVLAGNGKMYGITTYGGATGNGVLFSLDTATDTFTDEYDFYKSIDGRTPNGSLYQANDGLLYGTTSGGGTNNRGTLFSVNPVTNVHTTLYSFNFVDGYNPYANVVQASNGLLYGTTVYGGIYDTANGYYGDGVLFSYDIASHTYTKIHDFNMTNGAHPYGTLIQASDGKLYGTAPYGGYSNYSAGVLFSYDPATNVFADLYHFHWDGVGPMGSLMQANDGKLYGTTGGGGNGGNGVIFSYDIYNHIYTVLYYFTNSNNGYNKKLIQATNGKLYGLLSQGYYGGNLFSFDLSSNTYTSLCSFPSNSVLGFFMNGNLLQASDGELYAMAATGGLYSNYNIWDGFGTIVKFDIPSNTLSKVKDFKFIDGYAANADLIEYNRCVLTSLAVSANDTICPGDSVTLTATGATSYLWLPGNQTTASITVAPSSLTIYTVSGTSGTCRNSKNVMVMVNAAPLISPASPITMCVGDTTILTSSFGSSYLWNTGETTQSITVTTSGIYTVTVTHTNTNGCVFSSAPTVVTVNPSPAVPTITLSGDTLISSSTFGNQWYRNGNLIPGGVYHFFFPTQNGVYTLMVTNSYGCTSVSTPFNLVDLGIPEAHKYTEIFISPNPFNEQSELTFNTYSPSQNTTLIITDVFGREVKRMAVIQNKTQISRGNLDAGMYFYKVISQTNAATANGNPETIAAGKLIIQ